MSLTQVMILVEVDCPGIKTGPDRYHIDAPALNYKEMRSGTEPEGWAKIRERVIRSRAQELGRARENLLQCADVLPPHPHFLRALHHCERFLEHAITEQGLSARAHDRHPQSSPHRRRHRRNSNHRAQAHRRSD